MSDREQLIRQIAADLYEESLQGRYTSVAFYDYEWAIAARAVLAALERLGYSVTPAESPAETPRIASAAPEGSEAAHTAERRVLDAAEAWVGANRYDVYNSWDAQLAGAVGDMVHGRRRVAVETEETPT